MYGLNIFQRLYIAIFKNNAKRKLYKNALSKVSIPNLYPELLNNTIHFLHSGLIGDIIYSIPTMQALADGRKIQIHLKIDQKTQYKKSMKHYNQNKMLTKKTVELISPLLLSQPNIEVCDIYSNQRIDYDLDEFRKFPFDYNSGYICRYYFHIYGINKDLSLPWLFISPNVSFKDKIVIARSLRYRAPGINYKFLNNYPNIIFVGITDEYENLKEQLPLLTFCPVNNFLELASIIAACRFFIGNQSFPFALSEALKVKRALEVCFECPNVIPEGKDAYDFCYQPQFEKIVNYLLLASKE